MPGVPAPDRDWIAPLAEKERERRRRIDKFNVAVSGFVFNLGKALRADADRFEREFPDTKVSLDPPSKPGQIIISCNAYNPRTKATVQLNPEQQTLTCEFDISPASHPPLKVQLECSNLGIHTPSEVPETTIERLSGAILKPILFPALAGSGGSR